MSCDCCHGYMLCLYKSMQSRFVFAHELLSQLQPGGIPGDFVKTQK